MTAIGDVTEKLNYLAQLVNDELEKFKKIEYTNVSGQKNVVDAMWYSLSAGGKRIRPVLVLEFCRICGGDYSSALSAACAIEMMHTFSLIHDDLPCVDNDDFRRGKPSCHKAYGEVNALLAGDALENRAFGIIAECGSLTDSQKVRLIKTLSDSTGVLGMIGGQVIDTECENDPVTEELLLEMYGMKTGALLSAACKMGCICGSGTEQQLKFADDYGKNLGLAFQIVDDILDVEGSAERFGKPIGSDAENGKTTFASLCGIENAKKYAFEFSERALSALEAFSDVDFLKELTMFLLRRDY
ncbi:MAG: polyprenyl synthetase family protein [Oscillospiraceae bacterium]|nr:polyprenyl synthetase family protein [Oscillospiraceae bacterium]